ncbi:MAG: hypothetical protein LKJ50_11165 [Clostridiales bacterium]|jgi:hypothetical protein|nr:hypothetical protein [Clostridiales bacterium]MCI1962246.1 hypothetical protein [Clostridiales bacterium]MCI2022941.1 hypothetical protein [Clostridiales bacterium]MCI2027338.1 hypothetical protein [Clostridiales bacterium]
MKAKTWRKISFFAGAAAVGTAFAKKAGCNQIIGTKAKGATAILRDRKGNPKGTAAIGAIGPISVGRLSAAICGWTAAAAASKAKSEKYWKKQRQKKN